MTTQEAEFKSYVRDISDWPKRGILFRDITPLLASAPIFDAAIEAMTSAFVGRAVEYVAAVEARGFIFGAAVAQKLGVGFIPIRKKGKLPYETESYTYDLEYGTDTLEVHRDAIRAGAQVLIVDDLLATGGTSVAAAKLVEKIGGKVEAFTFLIELTDLKGRQKLSGYEINSVMRY